MTAAEAPPRRQIRRRPAGRKAMIITSARRLAVEGGLAAVSMEDIASDLGITAGALYRHFPGKTGIMEAVRADTLERFVTVADQARCTAGPGRVLRATLTATVRVALDDPSLLRVYTRESGASQSIPITAGERRLLQLWYEALQATRPDIPRGMASLRLAGVFGAIAETTSRTGHRVVRPAVEGLLSDAAYAVLVSRMVDVAPRQGGAGSRWAPPPSRRDEILACALRLFREQGFAGTSVDDIGRAVGLSGSGIYRSYQSKAEILLDAYDRTAARVEVGAEDALAAARRPLDALRRLALSYARIALDNRDLIVVTGREGSGLPEAERPRIARRQRALREAWVSVLRQARTDLPEPEARLLYRGALALANQAALFPKQEHSSPTAVAQLMLAFLLPTESPPN